MEAGPSLDDERDSSYENLEYGCEVVQVQVGAFANLVGAHYWNLQLQQAREMESPLRHEVVLQPRGIARAVVIDFRDNIGALGRPAAAVSPAERDLDHKALLLSSEHCPPFERVQVFERATGAISSSSSSSSSLPLAPAQAEERALTWSSLVQARFAEGSVLGLPESVVEGEQWDFEAGRSLGESEDWSERVLDALRRQLEACARPAGVQLWVDIGGTGGHAGLASALATQLRDELEPRAALLAAPLEQPAAALPVAPLALALLDLAEAAAVFLPVRGPAHQLAAALELAACPYRMHAQREEDMHSWALSLPPAGPAGPRLASLSLALPSAAPLRALASTGLPVSAEHRCALLWSVARTDRCCEQAAPLSALLECTGAGADEHRHTAIPAALRLPARFPGGPARVGALALLDAGGPRHQEALRSLSRAFRALETARLPVPLVLPRDRFREAADALLSLADL